MSELAVTKNQQLEQALQLRTGLAFAVLVCSQSRGKAHAQSGWDMSVQCRKELGLTDKLILTELLRHELIGLLDNEGQ